MVVEEQGLSYKGEDKCKEIRKTRRISEKEEELYQTFASGVHGQKFWMRNFYFRENEVGCSWRMIGDGQNELNAIRLGKMKRRENKRS